MTHIREGEYIYFFAVFLAPDLQLLLCVQARACEVGNKGSNFKEGQIMQHKGIPQTHFLIHVVLFFVDKSPFNKLCLILDLRAELDLRSTNNQ